MRDKQGWAGGLEQAVAAYKEGVTAETVTGLWQEFWRESGRRVRMELTVEPFPADKSGSLAEHLAAGDMPIYVPPRLAGQRERHRLGSMWPQMRSYSVEPGNRVNNEKDRNGWRYVEASLEVPHLNTTEPELKGILARLKRGGMGLNEYVIGSQISKKLTGHYFDEVTESRLLGSHGDGQVVFARFDSFGGLRVDPYWARGYRDGRLGGRSSEGV